VRLAEVELPTTCDRRVGPGDHPGDLIVCRGRARRLQQFRRLQQCGLRDHRLHRAFLPVQGLVASQTPSITTSASIEARSACVGIRPLATS
jgi:hypothetical protein